MAGVISLRSGQVEAMLLTTKLRQGVTKLRSLRESGCGRAAARLWGRGWPRGLLELAAAFALVAACRWEAVRLPYWWDSMGYVTDGAREIIAAHIDP